MSSSSSSRELDSARVVAAREAGESVVSLSDGRSQLSGVAVRADLVAAPAERLALGDEVRVHGAAGDAEGQVIALDLATDVGIVRATRVWTREARAASEAIVAGATVALVAREGPDVAIEWRAIRKVGAGWRSRRGGHIDQRIEIDSGLSLPDEGGAVVALDGGVIGMAVHGPHRRVLVIPFATIERVVGGFAEHGRLRHGYLGVSLLPLRLSREVAARWHTDATTALVVADVSPGSPAAAAGLDVGDLLVAADGAAISGVGALTALIRDRGPGQVLRLARRRGAAIDEVPVPLGERPAR